MTSTIDTHAPTRPIEHLSPAEREAAGIVEHGPRPLLTGSAPPARDLSPVERQLVALRPYLEPLFEDERHRAAFEVAVYQAAIREPDLHAATSASLSDAIMGCARLGLIPEGIDGHAVLTVRRDDRTGELRAECTVMVNGLCYLAIRDGTAAEIFAETIREGDPYKYKPTEKLLDHEVLFPRPKKVVAAYACVELKDGRKLYEVVDQADLEAAESASRGNIAWRVWEGQMCKKTARRRAVFTNGLLSPTTAAALGRVRVELDELIGRAPELGKAAPGAAAPAPSSEGTGAPAVAASAPSTPAAKLLDKIRSGRAQREAAAGGVEGAGPHRPADAPPPPASAANTSSSATPSAAPGKAPAGKNSPAAGKKSPTPSSPKSKTKKAGKK